MQEMIYPGKYNTLKVVKKVDFGVYLDGDDRAEILLPKRYLPDTCEVDDEIAVFIYFDSEDRIIATTEIPKVTVGECALLKVVDVTGQGAFVDWGLSKDLFVPIREQKEPMSQEKEYIVFASYDVETDRIFGSTRLEYYLDNTTARYEEGDAVEVIIAEQTDLGYKAIIENRHWGLLYRNEVFTPLHYGMQTTCYVKKLRDDEKIDLSLQRSGYDRVTDVTDDILLKIKQAGGTINVSDSSSPETIQALFGISKKTFKKALGALYKNRLVVISDNSIALTHKGKSKDVN